MARSSGRDAGRVLGFDGSYNRDATALVGCTLEDVPHVFVVGVWERPPGASGWVVPRDEVDECVARALERWNVLELAADPPGWHREIGEWADAYGSPPVIEVPTNNRATMSELCSRLYTAIVNKNVTHDGNPRLATHGERHGQGDTRGRLHLEGRPPLGPQD